MKYQHGSILTPMLCLISSYLLGCDSGSGNDSDSKPAATTPSTMTDCEGGKLDPETNLCWQEPPAEALWI